MWIFAVPLIAIAALIAGIVLIIKRQNKSWYLWAGIGLIILSLLSIPISFPVAVLGFILLTGGSFS